jgi:hypothetical protein
MSDYNPDYERGLAFLRQVNLSDGSDYDYAGEALFAVLELGKDPEEVRPIYVTALGRAIAEEAAK